LVHEVRSGLAASRERIRRDATLDGEMVVQDESGRTDFKKLVTAIRSENASLIFYAFDLLGPDGNDLRKQSCEDRRERLHDFIGDPQPVLPIQFSQSFEGSGSEFFAAVEQMNLEGIMSKRKASIYQSGDSKDWQKTKAYIMGEFVVIGYERKRGAAPSLLLAREDDDRMTYVSRAIPAIAQARRDELWQALEFLHTSHFGTPIGAGNKYAVPVHPILHVMAKHLKGEEKLRHATVTEVLTPQ
jgi:bifunctional non-homologous end joining protein LigD